MNDVNLRKAAGHDYIQNEHIIFGGSSLAVHLSLLCPRPVGWGEAGALSGHRRPSSVRLSV